MLCKCSLCGEELTAPQVYNGFMYGYSCVKKMYPNFKKPKQKPFFVIADSFSTEIIDQHTTKIEAIYKGIKFFDLIHNVKNILGEPIIRTNAIILQDNTAIIDLMKVKQTPKILSFIYPIN